MVCALCMCVCIFMVVVRKGLVAMVVVVVMVMVTVGYLIVHSCLMIAVSGVQQQCRVGRGGMREDVIVTELNGLFVPNIYTQASSHWWNIMHYFGARRKNNVLKLAYFFYVKAICRG